MKEVLVMNPSDNNQTKEIAVVYTVDDSEVKLTPAIVQNYILSGNGNITMPEFKMFSELCKVRKLNPFLKEAYIIKFGNNPATLVVGKEAILKRAIKHKDFNGRQQGIIVIDKSGNVIERNGAFYLQGKEQVVGGWAKVYKKGIDHPTYITVALEEAVQKKSNGEVNAQWSKNPATMIEKVALVRALRETFVEELGGMYDEVEAREAEARSSEQVIEHQPDTLEDATSKELTPVEHRHHSGGEDNVIEVDIDAIPSS